jgi:hypothetical protein
MVDDQSNAAEAYSRQIPADVGRDQRGRDDHDTDGERGAQPHALMRLTRSSASSQRRADAATATKHTVKAAHGPTNCASRGARWSEWQIALGKSTATKRTTTAPACATAMINVRRLRDCIQRKRGERPDDRDRGSVEVPRCGDTAARVLRAGQIPAARPSIQPSHWCTHAHRPSLRKP